MNTIFQKTIDLILANTLWIFFSMILFFSYILTILGPSNTFQTYLSSFFQLSILFSPIVLFTGFRKWLSKNLNKVSLGILWSFCFILYPFVIRYFYSSFPLSLNSSFTPDMGHKLFIIGLMLLASELAIQSNDHLLKQLARSKWIQKIDLEKGILGICVLIAMILGLSGTFEFVRESEAVDASFIFSQVLRFLSFSFQIFLILLAYYFFYYCNHYFLIPRILKAKGVIYYGFSVVASILIFYPIFIKLITYLPIVDDLAIGAFTKPQHIFGKDTGALPFFVMMISLPLIISMQWFKQNGEISLLEKEKSESELNLLKQQINPHFFFNTLNNLYALSLTKDESTPGVILQLSELMRYVIYRGSKAEVLLAEEVKYIEDYIHLQLIRLHQNLDFKFEKKIEDEHLAIPPLLFIILVENVFKHGMEATQEKCFLHLRLESNTEELLFICKNAYEPKKQQKAGIGIENLRRRLELLFPDRYRLDLTQNQNTYTASLKIRFS